MDVEDKHHVKVREWAEKVSPGYYKCSVCLPQKTLSFAQGKLDLLKHSQSERHRKAWESQDNQKRQSRIDDMLKSKESDSIQSKANDLETALCVLFAKHDIPFKFIECLDPLLKKYVPDSEIISKMRMAKDKVSYIMNHGLRKEFEKLTIEKLKNCVCFAVSIDESEVNKHNELEVVANIASKEGIVETLHYTTLG